MKKKNVAYIRMAHKSDAGVDLQKNIIECFAQSRNLEIDYYYIDNGYSGVDIDRPALTQLLRDIKREKVANVVIFKDMSRLGRDFNIVSKIVNEISKREVKLLFTVSEEKFYLDTLEALLMHERVGINTKKRATEFYKQKEREYEKTN